MYDLFFLSYDFVLVVNLTNGNYCITKQHFNWKPKQRDKKEEENIKKKEKKMRFLTETTFCINVATFFAAFLCIILVLSLSDKRKRDENQTSVIKPDLQ